MASDLYFDQTQFLLHADSEGAFLADSSQYARTVAQGGSSPVAYSTNAKTDFSGSLRATGNFTGLKIEPGSGIPSLAPGLGDFTIEGWVNLEYGGHNYNYNSTLFAFGTRGVAGHLNVYLPGSSSNTYIGVEGYGGDSSNFVLAPSAGLLTSGSWFHVAVTRLGTVWTIWVNGASVGTIDKTFNVTGSTAYLFHNTDTYNASGYFDEVRYTKGVARYTASFTVPAEPFPNKPPVWDVVSTDGIAVGHEGLAYGNQYVDTLTESVATQALMAFVWGIGWTDNYVVRGTPNTSLPARLADTFRYQDGIGRSISRSGAVSDTAGLTSSSTYYYRMGATAEDAARLLTQLVPSLKAQVTALDVALIQEALTAGRLALLQDGVSVADVMALKRGVQVTDALGITPVWGVAAHYGMTQTDRVRVVDVLRRFFGGDVVESAAVGDQLAQLARRSSALSDGIAVQSALAGSLVLRIDAEDSVNVTVADAVKMLFSQTLADGVDLSAAFVTPSGSVITWAVNVITGAVSEYDNYAFNSFARFGQMYIGADESGLYELNGCTDDGEAVIARIKSGLAQLTASRFTMIRDAYVGMRSNGSFVLRITTGEGETYDYKFDAQNMKTTRVPLGKGMRTRYVSFELIGEGDDFDLESVEFIPLMSKRRV